MADDQSILAAAVAHAKAGRRIFPCKPDKSPLTPHGFKDATNDPARVEAYWKRDPHALIGLETGQANGIFVFDVDQDDATGKDGRASLAALERQHGPLPPTIEVITPRGGSHLYFRHPGPKWEIRNSAGELAPFIDVRGDGGYVICPPSRLPDGRAYTWEGSSDPDEGVRAAPAPAWLLALVARPKGQATGPTTPPGGEPGKIPEGRRNDALFRLGRSLRAKNLTQNGILAALREENAARCVPPLPEAEIQAIGAKVCRVPAGPSKPTPDTSNHPPPWPDIETGPNDHHQEQPPGGDEWPEPADLSAVVVPEPYPVHCLPPVAREAVIEYQAFGQQPMSLVGMSALQNMALACQGLADVARNAHLVSPISLYSFLLAMSGERKSNADKVFGRAARDWQSKAREKLTPDYRRALAMDKAWHSRQEGVRKRITTLAAKDPDENSDEGKELNKLRDRLVELELNPVIARPLPMLFYEDVTPGGLQHSLATGWPSAGLFSDEGGTVIGGHGMGEDTATSMLATLNILWDGRPYIPTRKSAAAVELRGRRFSCFIMVQPELITKLLEKGARHIGFIARFLVADPVSTMGARPFRDPPGWQAMNAFDQDITHLLEQELPVDKSGSDQGLLMRLTPQVMHLSTRAKRRFIDYHDEVERQLVQFGELEGVRDIASKSAENACRIAAVCQIFDQGRPTPEVEEGYMEAGIGLASWHLNEAMRMFSELDGPQHISDAQELAAWLTGRGRELADSHGVPVIDERGGLAARDIQRVGPNRVRDSARRDAALAHLEECGWVRQFINGRQKRVLINPKLLKTQ